ncbi:MAG: hypothetical protein LBL86_00290 [Coriobacteriales bacterium]|jgi:uncharacterized Zn finger protein (UPF0148 family)|nr:hypothetical protein [Coriobacteriales bacterium]
MTAIEVSCSQCGANEYRLVDERTGEVACQYCRSQWVVPELARKTETEKFLEQQAQQPRVIHDNTTETDRQLMGMIASLAGGGLFAGLRTGLRRIAKALVIVAVLAVTVVVGVLVYALLVRGAL